MKHITFNVFSCLLFVDSETPSDCARCFSSLFPSLYAYTYTYTYCYYYRILYFLVLTKPAPAWVPVKASFSTSDTIVSLYRHRSTNRFASLKWTANFRNSHFWSPRSPDIMFFFRFVLIHFAAKIKFVRHTNKMESLQELVSLAKENASMLRHLWKVELCIYIYIHIYIYI